jgi:hypothetical protein
MSIYSAKLAQEHRKAGGQEEEVIEELGVEIK